MRTVHEIIIKPQTGLEAEASQVFEELGAVYAVEPGFVEHYALDGLPEAGLLAHVTVWESRHAADAAAQLDRTVAVRERLEALAVSTDGRALLDIISERSGELAPALA